MKHEITRKEMFVILLFFQSYWICIFIFKTPIFPLILGIIVIVLLFSLLFEKFFKIKENKIVCQKLSRHNEFFLISFLFGVRILFALLSLVFSWDISWVFGGLTTLNLIDSELNQIWCYSRYLRIFIAILNCFIFQILILI